MDSSLDGLAVVDREGRYTLWNRAMERFAGKTADEVLGRYIFDVFPFLRELGLDVAIARVLAGETVVTEGVAHVEADGTRRVYDRLYTPLRSERGEIEGVVAIVRDATARYAVLDRLEQSQASLRMAMEAGEVGLWSWNPATNVVVWEDTACRIFGLPPGGGPRTREAFLALVHPDDRAAAAERIASGWARGELSNEYRMVRGDGAVRWMISKARLLHVDGHDVVLGALFDITDRKLRDDRRHAAQRLETIGQLTAGIAHNFNNMLMALLPNLELAVRRAPGDLAPLLRDAQQAARRAADVVGQLMTYAGNRRSSARRVESLAELVGRTVSLARTTFDARIAVEVEERADVAALVDATQIEQALLNLLINARDALSGGAARAPRITVEVDAVAEGAPELEGRAGRWICVRVADNGVGMDDETLRRLYEPFFTTKEAGKGTGLGLATTHGIVRDHGGFITCRSAPGRGTTFALYLPAASTGAAAPEPAAAPSPAGPAIRRGVVLVVDDDVPVRRAISMVLADAGFTVETAATGEEALRLASTAEAGRQISLVLLDVSMPGIPGPLLRGRLRDVMPDVPVIYLTGYAYQATDGTLVLEKPVSADRLVAAVEAALAQASSS